MIARECGAGARVENFAAMEDGHAGLTFGFDVLGPDQRALGGYVLKLAPGNVARRGNTDVYRQAPLLRALEIAGLPVPSVPWASPDEAWLGSPFLIMERLPGRVFVVWEPHPSFPTSDEALKAIWLEAARLLARLHRIDWRIVMPDWETATPLSHEFARWPPVLRHAQDPDWRAAGDALGARLAACTPDDICVGVVHGDFQPGNILYLDGRARGLIDWELASIGSQALDVGWLLMMSDAKAWAADWRPAAPIGANEIVAAYRQAGGPAWRHLEWHQGLAHYRLGAIACLNVKLHRTGKRVDPLWERFAPSIPHLFGRGLELAEAAQRLSGKAR
jgi:aminoglycoside phosphotransferase (APT) family kinase protein